MSKWTSTKEQLPDAGSTVLAFWPPRAGPVHAGCFATATYAAPGHWHNPEDDDDDFIEPTHWISISAPEGKQQ